MKRLFGNLFLIAALVAASFAYAGITPGVVDMTARANAATAQSGVNSLNTTVAGFVSAESVMASGAVNTYTHGLGRHPMFVAVWIKCITVDGTWAVGDTILVSSGGNDYGNVQTGWLVRASATQIIVQLPAGNFYHMIKNGNSAAASLIHAKWNVFVTAF